MEDGMKIVAYMVVKNDEFYIDMALQSVLPFVAGIYIQDQKSTDGTTDIIRSFVNKYPDLIKHDVVDTEINERFDPNYNEPKYRSLAVQKAEELYNPEFILKLDADEIYTEHFFKSVLSLKGFGDNYRGAKVSGDRFISKIYKTGCPYSVTMSPQGKRFYDPHTQIWKADLHVRYYRNPAMSGFLHCVHSPDPQPVYWLDGICNIHLHRTFGPKAFNFWAEGGDIFERKTPFNPQVSAPKWYNNQVNIKTAEQVNFKWPSFVLDKWKEWGVWE
jgi:glycosyltransferase involved in cell wall biosynthesis